MSIMTWVILILFLWCRYWNEKINNYNILLFICISQKMHTILHMSHLFRWRIHKFRVQLSKDPVRQMTLSLVVVRTSPLVPSLQCHRFVVSKLIRSYVPSFQMKDSQIPSTTSEWSSVPNTRLFIIQTNMIIIMNFMVECSISKWHYLHKLNKLHEHF